MPFGHGTKNLKHSRPILHCSLFLQSGTSEFLLLVAGAWVHFSTTTTTTTTRSEKTGGGVLLYVKPHPHPEVITKPKISKTEVKYVQILSGSEKFILVLVYRPPAQNSNVDNELYEQISEICNHNDAIILGDFNLPVTVWDGTLNSHSGHELYSNILESSLYQHIHEPTRGEIILDIVLSTNDNQIDSADIGPEFSTNDHRSFFFAIECNTGVHNNSYEKVPDFQ